MAKKGSFYPDDDKGPDYFAQGFRLGLVFGALGALVMLGRGDLLPKRAEPGIITTTGGNTTIDTTTPVTVTMDGQPRVNVERTVVESDAMADAKTAELPAGTSLPRPPDIVIPQTDPARLSKQG